MYTKHYQMRIGVFIKRWFMYRWAAPVWEQLFQGKRRTPGQNHLHKNHHIEIHCVCKDVLSSIGNHRDLASESEMVEIPTRDKDDLIRIQESILTYLKESDAGWKDITMDNGGPSHKGWSRLATIGKKSRIFYDLLREKDNSKRNDCERDWSEQGITFQDEKAWDKIYRLHAKTKTNE